MLRHPLVTSIVSATAFVLLVGTPTDVIPNPLFTRMTPVRLFDYLLLCVNALLFGIWVYLSTRKGCSLNSIHRPTISAMLSFLAIGCPTCNKLVLLLVGASGALNFWAPIQPVVGSVATALMASVVIWELRRLKAHS